MSIIPICVRCKHLHPDWTCDAFPDGIPREIKLDEVDHRKPIEGDHGIQFEPIRKPE